MLRGLRPDRLSFEREIIEMVCRGDSAGALARLKTREPTRTSLPFGLREVEWLLAQGYQQVVDAQDQVIRWVRP